MLFYTFLLMFFKGKPPPLCETNNINYTDVVLKISEILIFFLGFLFINIIAGVLIFFIYLW